MKYINEFLHLSRGPELQRLKLFPNAKEITESFSGYNAVREMNKYSFGDSGITAIIVGDGHSPRTGATFAFRSAWDVHSIDPVLRLKKEWLDIPRLRLHAKRIEEVEIECERAVIVAIHSHADLRAAVRAVRAKEVAVIAMPCCFEQGLDREPDLAYEDPWVHSPHRKLLIWNG